MNKKVCLIGHRNVSEDKVREKLKKAVQCAIREGYRRFLVGTHRDFDRIVLSLLIEIKKEYKDIEIEVVLTAYHPQDKNEYKDFYTVMYNIEEEHYKRKITSSNRQMVDDCDYLICYVNEKRYKSGAKTALNYAKKHSKRILNLYY